MGDTDSPVDLRAEMLALKDQLTALTRDAQAIGTRLAALEARVGGPADPDPKADTPRSASGGSILVVDDSRIIRTTIHAVLARAGFDVTEASSVDEALAILKERPFDLIIVDLYLGTLGGSDLVREIRQNQKNEALPIIVCSSSDDVEDYRHVGRFGVHGIVRKPVNRDQLIAVVREHVRSDGRGVAATERPRPPAGAVATFLETGGQLLGQVQAAVVSDDAAALTAAAEALGAAAIAVSGDVTADLAGTLERLGRTGDLTSARDVYLELETACHQLSAELERAGGSGA